MVSMSNMGTHQNEVEANKFASVDNSPFIAKVVVRAGCCTNHHGG